MRLDPDFAAENDDGTPARVSLSRAARMGSAGTILPELKSRPIEGSSQWSKRPNAPGTLASTAGCSSRLFQGLGVGWSLPEQPVGYPAPLHGAAGCGQSKPDPRSRHPRQNVIQVRVRAVVVLAPYLEAAGDRRRNNHPVLNVPDLFFCLVLEGVARAGPPVRAYAELREDAFERSQSRGETGQRVSFISVVSSSTRTPAHHW